MINETSKGLLCAITLSASIIGCGYVEKDDWMPVQTQQQIGDNPDLMARLLSDTTVWSHVDPYQGGHGSQIEYHSADGRAFLWYPGNQRPVEGRWKIDRTRSGKATVCYMYGANTYNPVTRQRGGEWECTLAAQEMLYGDEWIKGDPFRLSTGNVPFVIPDQKVHFPRDLYAQWGRNPTDLDYITNLGEID